MVVIAGYFYEGQDERLRDEAAVLRAVDEATDFLLSGGWTNVMVEVDNECNARYEHAILQPQGVHELIVRVKARASRLLVSTSYGGRQRVPDENVAAAADYILIHGNRTTSDPDEVAEQIERTRRAPGYAGQPIVYNEDDHFDFDRPWNDFTAALSRHVSWGYFDPGAGVIGAGASGDYVNGYQLVPVNWRINTERKHRLVSGSTAPVVASAGCSPNRATSRALSSRACSRLRVAPVARCRISTRWVIPT